MPRWRPARTCGWGGLCARARSGRTVRNESSLAQLRCCSMSPYPTRRTLNWGLRICGLRCCSMCPYPIRRTLSRDLQNCVKPNQIPCVPKLYAIDMRDEFAVRNLSLLTNPEKSVGFPSTPRKNIDRGNRLKLQDPYSSH